MDLSEMRMQDILDSRDVYARIEELEDMEDEDNPWGAEECEEYDILVTLRDEARGYCPDWVYGGSLISDNYFEDYARDLAKDIGAIGRDVDWPCTYIDWTAAADALKMDYSEVDLDGVGFWRR